MRNSLLLLALILTAALSAQATTGTGLYFIGFTDKAVDEADYPYSIDRPEEFLSPRALSRRAKHGAVVTELDLPINPAYETELRELGLPIWLRSKWMNGVVIAATPEEYAMVRELPFVDSTYYAAPLQYERSSPVPLQPRLDRPAPRVGPVPVSEKFYGFGWKNLTHLGGDSLHQQGFRGAGVLVAVFDGGFPDVGYKDFLGYDQAAAVPANYDFVEQDTTALDGSTHGATVVSTMAAHHPFFFIGTRARGALSPLQNRK